MITKICKEVSKNTNEDFDLVYKIAMFQFQFIKNVMQDENDKKDILINKLFRFKLKNKFK